MNQAVVLGGSVAEAFHESPVDFSSAGDSSHFLLPVTPVSVVETSTALPSGLAEAKAESWYLGVVGAGLSFSAGVGSILRGWLAHRFDGRTVFVSGAVTIGVSISACALGDRTRLGFLAGYWLLGIGLGCL